LGLVKPGIWIIISGITTLVTISYIIISFEEYQITDSEHNVFLNKIYDYVNENSKDTKKIISYLLAEAETKQTRLGFLKPDNERQKIRETYAKIGQKIDINLHQNGEFQQQIKEIKILFQKNKKLSTFINLLSNLILNQFYLLTFAKNLNRSLLFLERETYLIALKEINLLIESYSLINNTSLQDGISPHIFYNLRSLAHFRYMLENISDTDQFIEEIRNIFKQDLDVAISYEPKNPYSYMQKSYMFLQISKKITDYKEKERYLVEAEIFAKKSYELAPKDPGAINSIGLCYQERENYQAAFYYFSEALILLPNNPALLHNMARICLKLGKPLKDNDYFQKAYSYSADALRIKPNDILILTIAAEAAAKLKKCQESKDILEKIKVICDRYNTCKDHSEIFSKDNQTFKCQ